jgi:hypothetical protein
VIDVGCERCFVGSAEQVYTRMRDLELVESLVDESHFSVHLKRCAACGQRFVSVFCESIDWSGGNDPQQFFWAPITAEEATSLRGLDENATERAILAIAPKRGCLDVYWPSSGDKQIDFVEGPTLLAPHD